MPKLFPEGRAPYVIAEIGANHNGEVALAKKLVDAAKACGCDAAKFQSWDSRIFSRTVYEQNYFLGDDYRGRKDFTLKEIVEEFALDDAEFDEIAAHCRSAGVDFASTPFENEQVDALVRCRAPFVKIASMDVNNDRLLRHAAATGKPIVLSTGMAELGEIERAVRILEDAKAAEIVILHCVSVYPAPPEILNLRNIETLRRAFGHAVGFSDHTLGIGAPVAAAALGAVVIEKHFTLDRDMFGWDHKVSTTPAEMALLVQALRDAHAALGSPRRELSARERDTRSSYRRSLVSARPLAAGRVIGADDIVYRRPGTGIDPSLAEVVVGMRARRDIADDTVLDWRDIEPAHGG